MHGHHMKDGTMFAGLRQYQDADWREKHKDVFLYLADEMRSYHVFAAVRVDLMDEASFRYEELPSDAAGADIYLQELKKWAFWYEDPTYEEQDRLLLLSTCDYGTENERLVVYGIAK